MGALFGVILNTLSTHCQFATYLRIALLIISLSDIFDVVRDTKDHVYLLDFAPFNEKWSESLAFEWNELTVDDDVVNHSFPIFFL